MNYILLGRQLDTIAQQDGYQYCPDDILKEILEYTGRIDYKPTFLYQVEVKFSYDLWSRRRLMDSSDDEEEYKPKMLAKSKIGYNYYYYCGCCDRIYQSYKTHIRRQKHITNTKKGDLGKDIKVKVMEKTLVRYVSSKKHKNMKIKHINMKDVWSL